MDNAANVYCCMCRKSLVLYVFSRDLGGYTTILSIKSQITKWLGKVSVQFSCLCGLCAEAGNGVTRRLWWCCLRYVWFIHEWNV
ncbi:hypothetical protein ANAPC1_00775 [Anaplasma phagocytophilum]|uniref:Uncharacterized protein n=1 Tax=Anaplasma phagocytophilum TaxID=948 RepID=A0AA45UT90_ANAPH|nr:hypothetical protein ANAPC1_00775 [Anaplasma phagocytophilum]